MANSPAKNKNGQTTQYTYDELGNLLHVTLPNGAQLGPIAKLDVNGNLIAQFIYDNKPHPRTT